MASINNHGTPDPQVTPRSSGPRRYSAEYNASPGHACAGVERDRRFRAPSRFRMSARSGRTRQRAGDGVRDGRSQPQPPTALARPSDGDRAGTRTHARAVDHARRAEDTMGRRAVVRGARGSLSSLRSGGPDPGRRPRPRPITTRRRCGGRIACPGGAADGRHRRRARAPATERGQFRVTRTVCRPTESTWATAMVTPRASSRKLSPAVNVASESSACTLGLRVHPPLSRRES